MRGKPPNDNHNGCYNDANDEGNQEAKDAGVSLFLILTLDPGVSKHVLIS